MRINNPSYKPQKSESFISSESNIALIKSSGLNSTNTISIDNSVGLVSDNVSNFNVLFEQVLSSKQNRCIIFSDKNGYVRNVSSNIENLFSVSILDIIGSHIDLSASRLSPIDKKFRNFKTLINYCTKEFNKAIFIKKDGIEISIQVKFKAIINYDLSEKIGYLWEIEKLPAVNKKDDNLNKLNLEASHFIGLMHNEEGKIIEVNSEARIFAQQNNLNNTYFNLRQYLPADFQNNWHKYIDENISKGFSKGEINLINNNGEVLTFLYKSRKQKYSDNKTIIICELVDVSHYLKDKNELIQKNKEALKKAQNKDLFIATLSHELRTPLGAIRGFGKLLENSVLSNNQKENILAINTASESMMHLCNDILDISKIESGHLMTETSPLNIKESIFEVHKILNQAAIQKGLQLICEVEESVTPLLLGDAKRIKQVLINLVSNAIKFSTKGNIIIKTCVIEDNDHDCSIRFSVIDNGVGISQNNFERIFEQYTQLNNSNESGTGLGLYISKSIVNYLGGNLDLKSSLNHGSEFYFKLSFKKHLELDTLNENKYSTLKGIKVLLVEDNYVNQILVKKILENKGIECTLVNSGEEAIEILEKKSFDLILLDQNLQKMNGIDTSVIIKNKLKSKTPILCISANSKDEIISRFNPQFIDDYLLKPINTDELYSKIKEHTFSSVIELSYLRSISDNNKNFEKEILETSIIIFREEIYKLKIALAEEKVSDFKSICHKLLSSYAVLGIKPTEAFEKISFLSNYNLLLKKYFNEISEFNALIISSIEKELRQNYPN